MSILAAKITNLKQSLAEACSGLVHPNVGEGEERDRQMRLMGVLLVAPFVLAAGFAQYLPGVIGLESAVVASLGLGAAALIGPILLIATARRRAIEMLALCVGVLAVAGIVAAAGGPVSPVAAIALALGLETAWISRSSKAKLYGLAAIAAAIVGSHVAVQLFGLGSAGVAAGASAWTLPVLYALTWMPRLRFADQKSEAEEVVDTAELLAHRLGASILHFGGQSELREIAGDSATLFGLAPEMLLGSGFFDRLHVSDRVAFMTALSGLRGENRQVERLTLRLRVPGPRDEQQYSTYRAEMFSRGEGVVTALLRQDDALDEVEAELREARIEAESAATAKTRFLASVSHELRTPLNAIVGFSDVLKNEMFGAFANEKQREYVGLIREAGDHLLSVVNTILDVSKVQNGSYVLKPEPFSIADAVRLSVSLGAQSAAGKGLAVHTEIAEDVAEVTCDRRAVQQILINLISNAVKFTPEGEIRVSAERCDGRLELSVHDTGIGIGAEDLERLGTPFMQVDNAYTRQFEGTGLGLALVKGLVALQCGSMRIESAEGEGTSVYVSLPENAGGVDKERENAQNGDKNEWTYEPLRKTA
ncbi:sensor histidine kinase [Nitratireductor basaltis]|uniref:histidine kinase n=1 Tax=Nitratireductor basaltis TaxID=472175 RepID=A0A084UCI2_9HYPH|nr:HAMP domain-containing sensor histidine kinase [Nitratireductor basaltis]KFB10668.1 Multi-sensor signal transduction histidine kinase [Nitratireductor basaltis]